MFGDRVKRARAAAGMSMRELGRLAGVSANMIKKYEHGVSMPSSSVLLQLARALNVRSEYFFRSSHITLGNLKFRRHAKMNTQSLNNIEANVLDALERWEELKQLWPNFPLQSYAGIPGLPDVVVNSGQMEEIAMRVREAWALGSDPIQNLIEVLEHQGILVFSIETGENRLFDGLHAMYQGTPIIVCEKGCMDGARQRFTLAHELGHLILDGRVQDPQREEKFCHRFAGAFLLPADSMKRVCGSRRRSLEMQELLHLKQSYGLSMQACLHRAMDLSIISESTYRTFMIEFSKRGWRTQEPGEVFPAEASSMFRQLVFRALGEHIIQESKSAELLGLPLMTFLTLRSLEQPDGHTHQ